MALFTMTYGTMPMREQFDQACSTPDDEGRTVSSDGFGFGNDERLGTCRLSQDELWDEILEAYVDYSVSDEAHGSWLSSVLGSLDIEWV